MRIIRVKEQVILDSIKNQLGKHYDTVKNIFNNKDIISAKELKEISCLFDFFIISDSFSKEENLKVLTEQKGNISREPFVAIMGHVNHGKTTLIDNIMKTTVAESEWGSITQKLTFYNCIYNTFKFLVVDTPGHEVFQIMRALTIKICDIVVLIVSMEEGIKNQTIEILRKIEQKRKIICLTKADKVRNIDQAKQKIFNELAGRGILVESMGGDIHSIDVSSVKQLGIDSLVESIKEDCEKYPILYNPNQHFVGIIVNSFIRDGVGIIAEVIILNGTIKQKLPFWINGETGIIKGIFSPVKVQEARAGQIVQILGFKKQANIGDYILGIESTFSDILPSYQPKTQSIEQNYTFICKTDSLSQLYTLQQIVSYYGHVIQSTTGNITPTEIEYGKNFGAIFVFWCNIDSSSERLLNESGVKFLQSRIIYEIQEKIDEMLKPKEEKVKEECATLNVIRVFRMKSFDIAGCVVVIGKVEIGQYCVVFRDNKEIMKGKIRSLQVEKNSVEIAGKGTECGIVINKEWEKDRFQIGDKIICYK